MALTGITLVCWINFFLGFAVQGTTIFTPLFAEGLGATAWQIGLLGSMLGGSYLGFSIAAGRLSDYWGRLAFVRIGCIIAVFSLVGHLLVANYATLLVARTLLGVGQGLIIPPLVAYASDMGANMGKYSSIACLGWIFGALTCSFVSKIEMLFVIALGGMVIALIMVLLYRPRPAVAKEAEVDEPTTAALPVVTEEKKDSFLHVLKEGKSVYFSVFLRHLGASAVWMILPLYFESIGLGRFWLGILWALNYVGSFVTMRLVATFDPKKVFAAGQVLSLLVFGAYLLFDQILFLLITQFVLGIGWGCLYMGALYTVLDSTPCRGTASGLLQGTLNLCAVLGPLCGGFIAGIWGYRGVIAFAFLLGLFSLLVIPEKRKSQKKKHVPVFAKVS